MRQCGGVALQCRLLAAVIVVHEEHAERCPVVVPLLGKAVGQSVQSLDKEPDRPVMPLYVARAYLVLLVNVAEHRGFVRAYYLRWRVRAVGVIDWPSVNFHHNAVVYAMAQV